MTDIKTHLSIKPLKPCVQKQLRNETFRTASISIIPMNHIWYNGLARLEYPPLAVVTSSGLHGPTRCYQPATPRSRGEHELVEVLIVELFRECQQTHRLSARQTSERCSAVLILVVRNYGTELSFFLHICHLTRFPVRNGQYPKLSWVSDTGMHPKAIASNSPFRLRSAELFPRSQSRDLLALLRWLGWTHWTHRNMPRTT